MSKAPIGLYLHLPFCTRICHYCDFVKSALYTTQQQSIYLEALKDRIEDWIEAWPRLPHIDQKLCSVFWGGGTPSLITDGFQPIMDLLRPLLHKDAEVSLEGNPEHVHADNVSIWAELGFNRMSLGVQSFQSRGLKALTREHSPDQAVEAVRCVQARIPNVNVDLIYGWPEQSERDWEADIDQVLALRPAHLSLYNLTFEGHTPFARRVDRGLLKPSPDETLEGFYTLACERLAAAGYIHEEVSNWALPGYLTRHNALYWNGGSYLGLGAGAHGYLETVGDWGLRWQQDPNWRQFKASAPSASRTSDWATLLAHSSITQDLDRDAEAWILEVVSSGLRTAVGINLNAICAKTGYSFRPRKAVEQAFDLGLMNISPSGQLTLVEAEWFRETRWSLEISLSFIRV